MTKQRNWSREETLLAFRLYCYTPFGQLHSRNPDIIDLAKRIGRSPGAVNMKACNFAGLDPIHQTRGIVGLTNRSRLDEQIWEEFSADSESIAAEAEAIYELSAPGSQETTPKEPIGPTEVERTIRTRRVQGFFRKAVLTGYGNRCALTGLAVPQLLNASHIIPWATPGSEQHRADPTNGLCLNALHDRAFDRGLISFDNECRLLVSPHLAEDRLLGDLAEAFVPQMPLMLPERFAPNPEALAYHRNNLYHAS